MGGRAAVRGGRRELGAGRDGGTAALGLRLLGADAVGALGPMTAAVVALGRVVR